MKDTLTDEADVFRKGKDWEEWEGSGKRKPSSIALGAAAVAAGIALALSPSLSFAQDTLPKPYPPFTGKTDIDFRKSVPAWPKPVQTAEGAPNILLILVDDVGFGVTSTFGGPVNTPNFTRLAADGLRYNEFQVNALCSPTRAALLSGRNAHEVGFGVIAERAAGYPGYNTLWPKSAASIAEVLKDNGYSTAAFGKWHNTPMWQVSPAGPFDRWPTGLGFEYFYGFMSGADSQYYTRLYRDTTPVEPASTPAEGYDSTEDLTNDAIRWIHQHDAVANNKPFFIYFATGATHDPHQAPKEWIEKYKGKFDQGWDRLREETFARQKQLGVIPSNAKLTPRPEGLPAWNSLTEDERRLFAHQAEVYAGYAEQADYEIGRLLQAVKTEGKSQNTIVLWIYGDNGASPEGGPLGRDAYDVNGEPKTVKERLATDNELGGPAYFVNHFAQAWAWGLDAPFQSTKQDASHLGGTRDPMVISWPAKIRDIGGLRSQFSHVTDIAPTLYQVAGIVPPKYVNGVRQTPLEGVSLVYTFEHPNAPSRHHVQYLCSMQGNRAIYKDGWWAGDLERFAWDPMPVIGPLSQGRPYYDAHPWELYNLNNDYSQADNLASKYPAKLKEMKLLFDEEAKRNHVYPIMPPRGRYPTIQPQDQTAFTYHAGVDRLTYAVAPKLGNMRYTISADIDIPMGGASGVIFAEGGRYGGVTLFIKDNRVVYEINASGNRSGRIVASDPLVAGKAHIVVDVTPDGDQKAVNPSAIVSLKSDPGTGALRINGKAEGGGRFANVNNIDPEQKETLDIGEDLGSAVSQEYQSPNRFTGKIEAVTIQLQQPRAMPW